MRREDPAELADVDPCLQAGDPQSRGGLARAGDRRAARIPGGESDGCLTGLYRGAEGVFRKAPAEMGRQVTKALSRSFSLEFGRTLLEERGDALLEIFRGTGDPL